MSDQPWIVAEKYRQLPMGHNGDEGTVDDAMVVVGPFKTEGQANAYAEWVTAVTDRRNLYEIAVGRVTAVPPAFPSGKV